MGNDEKKLDDMQALLLFKLLFSGEEPKLSEAKPDIKASRRDKLKDLGLIEYDKRDSTGPKGGKSKAQHIVLTDEAWRWAAQHLDAKISHKSIYAAHALSALLIKLKAYLDQNGVSLAELLASESASDKTASQPENLESRIREAYRALANGEWNVRVRLADLRPRLSNVSREVLDETLLRMQRDGKLVLYTNDDPLDLTPADHEAALHILGAHRHLIYMGNE